MKADVANTGAKLVETVTMADIVGDRSEDLLLVKMDIEGGERDVLSRGNDWLKAGPVIMIEPHDGVFQASGSLAGLLAFESYREGTILVKGPTLMFVPQGFAGSDRCEFFASPLPIHPMAKGAVPREPRHIANALYHRGHTVRVITVADEEKFEIRDGVEVKTLRTLNIYWNYWIKARPPLAKLVWHALENFNPRASAADASGDSGISPGHCCHDQH